MKQKQLTPKERLDVLLPYVREYQKLAAEFGIDDVFQDNGGKLLQVLIATGLSNLPGREGNDAVDSDGNECELKTVNVLKQHSVTTHHHLNPTILEKYRRAVWYIATFEGIELRDIYYLLPEAIEDYFSDWEKRLLKRNHLNNPKMNIKEIRKRGVLTYQNGEKVLAGSTATPSALPVLARRKKKTATVSARRTKGDPDQLSIRVEKKSGGKPRKQARGKA